MSLTYQAVCTQGDYHGNKHDNEDAAANDSIAHHDETGHASEIIVHQNN